MKVTVRTAVVGMATAVVLAQAVVAADFSVVGHGIAGDRLYAEIEPVGGSVELCPDGAIAFIEACRTGGGAVSTGPGWCRRSAWERVMVCSPLVGGGRVRRYDDRGFWAVAGSPVESVDFLLVDTMDGAEQSVLLQSAGGDSSLLQQGGIAEWGHTYSPAGFGAVYAAAGGMNVSWAGRGL
ncbi:MAG: hypothetical protein ACYST6_00110 [Planctomycetota bacterium]|jgi:hypothetical protein